MTFDFWSLLTLISLVLIGVLLSLYNGRMTSALNRMRSVAEDWYIAQVKDRRETTRRGIKVSDPLDWFARQLGETEKLVSVQSTQGTPLFINCLAEDHHRVVVTPLPPEEFRRQLRWVQTGRGSRMGNFIEPVLGRNPWRVKRVERSVLNGGEWFDVEAGQAGKALNIDWGEPERLWFYTVPQAKAGK